MIPHTKLPRIQVGFSLVDSSRMRELNRVHRGKDYDTDVLSFELNEDSPEGTYLSGDIVVCKEKIIEQALEHGVSFEEEFAFMVAHGAMHLMGLDHEHLDAETDSEISEV